MPHYPDEIEYSDKYMDDYYEYRHVILPKDVYKRLPRARLLSETVTFLLFRNGDRLVCNSREDGCITSCISQNPTSSSSGEPREVILRLDFPLRDSLPLPTPLSSELMISINPIRTSNLAEQVTS
jgi:hypothetical protein